MFGGGAARCRAVPRGVARCRAGASGDGRCTARSHLAVLLDRSADLAATPKADAAAQRVGPAGAALCRRARLAGKVFVAPAALKHVDPARIPPATRHSAELAGAVLDTFVREPGALDAEAPLVDHTVVPLVDPGHVKLMQKRMVISLKAAHVPFCLVYNGEG